MRGNAMRQQAPFTNDRSFFWGIPMCLIALIDLGLWLAVSSSLGAAVPIALAGIKLEESQDVSGNKPTLRGAGIRYKVVSRCTPGGCNRDLCQ